MKSSAFASSSPLWITANMSASKSSTPPCIGSCTTQPVYQLANHHHHLALGCEQLSGALVSQTQTAQTWTIWTIWFRIQDRSCQNNTPARAGQCVSFQHTKLLSPLHPLIAVHSQMQHCRNITIRSHHSFQ
jgi:hypothetical protein